MNFFFEDGQGGPVGGLLVHTFEDGVPEFLAVGCVHQLDAVC